MAPLRLVAALAFATTACVQQQFSDPATFPQPTVVAGPPGGEMDPEWQPRSSGDYADATVVEPSLDPDDPGYAMGTVTDAEIELTLDGYGEWIETEDYGNVWRPYATDVGVDFTPYESCGSWVWTDWGWTFTCDYAWGWLPFHYGTWGWFDDYWAWVPDYTWTPAAVEWRGGGGYVGWRPQAPKIRDHRGQHAGPTIRDHRGDHRGPVVRDHRKPKQYASHWRFATEASFGKPHIRAHVTKSPAEGLRVTQLQPRPFLRGSVQAIRAASLMRSRFANTHGRAQAGTRPATTRPVRFDRGRPPVYDRNPARARAYDRAFSNSQPSVYQPGYTQTAPAPTPPRHDHALPAAPPSSATSDDRAPEWTTVHPINGTPTRDPAWQTQSPVNGTPTRDPRTPAWRDRVPDARPARPSHDRPAWTPPPSATPTWTRPTRPAPSTWSPPSRAPSAPSTWSPPSRPSSPPSSSSTWSPPSRPSSPPSSSSPPPRASSSSSSWSPSRAPSAPSAPARSSGGGWGGARRH